MHRAWKVVLSAALLALAAGCGGKGSTVTPPAQSGSSFSLQRTVAVPNTGAGASFSFDIGAVDPTAQRYYLADRTNKSLDILDLGSYTLRQVGGFAGVGSSSSTSGPDGVVTVTGSSTVYVGDVNSVKVVDASAGTVTATIPIAISGFRTDEGCYDPDDGLVMFANPADSPPFATWISTKTNTIVAKYTFTGSTGLEQCVYDPQTKNFFVNNDATPTNPTGELDVIAASSVAAGTPSVANAYPETGCNPSGLALGPNETLFVGCTPPNGSQLISLMMNATNGSIVKTVAGIGGEDEVAYDPKLNRYYTSSDVMTASGVANSTGPFTPVLGVIDASSQTLIKTYPTATGAHSVAADPTTGRVFVPIPPTATAAGGIQVYGP
ncbi:MAG TPA: hypothetical protein VMA36_02545 [Candidatus Limnocylindria bacterium]|nr:hypothetical protein [Candidatus Limnocylindria bacterium]